MTNSAKRKAATLNRNAIGIEIAFLFYLSFLLFVHYFIPKIEANGETEKHFDRLFCAQISSPHFQATHSFRRMQVIARNYKFIDA